MALTSAFATVQAAPSLDAEFRFRGVYFPDAEPDQDGGRAVARLGLRDPSFLGASLRADVVARASDTSWDRGEVVEPGEIHLTWFGDAGLLRIGRQQIAWGRADAFRLLDVVNPQRYPDALFDDPADARIPLWMVNLEGTTGDLQWQAIAGYDRQLGAADPAWPQFRVDPDPSPENEGEAHLLGVRTSVLVGMTDMGLYWLDSPTTSRHGGPTTRAVCVRCRCAGNFGDSALTGPSVPLSCGSR